LRLRVTHPGSEAFSGLSVDESVSVNGACQTVVSVGEGWFEVDTIEETVKKTTLGSFSRGSRVNLERAVRPMDRLGGHFVLGHVDCVGRVSEVKNLGQSREISISFPEAFDPYVVPVGSIAVDGVSLTVARSDPSLLSVAIIPYTFHHTTISGLSTGSEANLEFDILGKYVAKQQAKAGVGSGGGGRISETWLREHGFS